MPAVIREDSMRPGARTLRAPITEELHPDGPALCGLSILPLLNRLHRGDAEAARAVGRALPALAALVETAAAAFRCGGTIAYAGAGTSGRLCALDAAECPPTFGVPPSRVVALVAGGALALRRAVEGAEDDARAGRDAVRRAGLGKGDLLVGVSASGRTRFVLAALSEARRHGAATALLTSDPGARAAVDHRVVLETGPERIAGSTRMKAGTAAKMALGLFSTATFVRQGAVRNGLMAAFSGKNAKLRARALRNVAALAGVGEAVARRLLGEAGWDVARALSAAREPPAVPPQGRARKADRSRRKG